MDTLSPDKDNVILFKEGKYISRNFYEVMLPSKDNDLKHVTFKCNFAISKLNTINIVYSSLEKKVIKSDPYMNEYGIIRFNNDVNTPLSKDFIDIYLNGIKLDNDKHLLPINNNIIIIKDVSSLFDLEILSNNITTDYSDIYKKSAKEWDVYNYYNNMSDDDIIKKFNLKSIDNSDYRHSTSILLPVIMDQYIKFWEEYSNKIVDSNYELNDDEKIKYSALINRYGNVMIDLNIGIGTKTDLVLNANDFDKPFLNNDALSFFTHQQLHSYTHNQLHGIVVKTE